MRSAILGGYFHDDPQATEAFVRASTEITHTDRKAMIGALAVAKLAASAVEHEADRRPNVKEMGDLLMQLGSDEPQWQRLVCEITEGFSAGLSLSEFAAKLGLENGVTGYIYHTVPVAAYAWLRHYGDFRTTVEAVLDCGGDTDTAGAIAGALAGATVGVSGIPDTWLECVMDWPRSVRLLQRVAERLARQRDEGRPLGAVGYCWPGVLPRNLLFLAVVLFHGFRRLAPPY